MASINFLIRNIQSNEKLVRSTAFKELRILAVQHPERFKPYIALFLSLLKYRENRVQWEVMTLLSLLAPAYRQEMFEQLDVLLEIAENGSVVTRDHYVKILAVLAQSQKYSETAIPLLVGEVLTAPVNQMPTYAAIAFSVIDEENKVYLQNVIVQRLDDVAEFSAKHTKFQKLLHKLRA